MKSLSAETNNNIESLKTAINTDIANIRTELSDHSSRLDAVEIQLNNSNHNQQIDELSLQIELLKQEKLKNNLRFTGLPPCAFNDPDETILHIAESLNIDIIPSEYTVYVDRNKSSIIVCFETYALKRITMDAMRKKNHFLSRRFMNKFSQIQEFTLMINYLRTSLNYSSVPDKPKPKDKSSLFPVLVAASELKKWE